MDPCECWIMDSGASQHMSTNRNFFTVYTPFDKPSKINGICDYTTCALGKGTIEMTLYVNGKPTHGSFNDILYIPNLGKNLFSISKAMHEGKFNFIIKNNKMIFSTKDGKQVLIGTEFDNIYYIDGQVFNGKEANKQANSATATNDMKLWHQRLGHVNTDYLRFMVKNNTVLGLPTTSGNLEFCEVAQRTRSRTFHSRLAEIDRTTSYTSYILIYADR
jgi:hypothetical protein